MSTFKLLILLGGLLFLAPVAANAKIAMYTDSSGKVHITNNETTESEITQTKPLRSNPPGSPNLIEHQPGPPSLSNPSDYESPEESKPPQPHQHDRQIVRDPGQALNFINTAAEPGEASALMRKAAARSDQKRPIRKAGAQRQAEVPEEGTIRISQNEQGVLIITNLPEKNLEAPAITAREKKRQTASEPSGSPVFHQDSPLYGKVIPAACSYNPSESFSTELEEGSIRRYRDKKGVVCISNVQSTIKKNRMPAVAPPVRLGEVAAMPPTMVPSPLPQIAYPPADKSKAEVVVSREKGGRLRIYTKEPERQVLARGPFPPTLDKIDPALAPIVMEAANAYQLPTSLILSVIRQESNFVSRAISPKGAMGLMQLMPGTAADLGVEDPFCPRQNVMGGSRHLRELLNRFKGSLPLAVAAYNAGQHRVEEAGFQIPEIKETKQFVSQVIEMYSLLEKMSFLRRSP